MYDNRDMTCKMHQELNFHHFHPSLELSEMWNSICDDLFIVDCLNTFDSGELPFVCFLVREIWANAEYSMYGTEYYFISIKI